jgi:MOSC domain-containing protein YiiM
MSGTVLAVCISEKAGTKKQSVSEARLRENHGIEGDAHARDWHRQVSLLADEDAQTMRDLGARIGPGDFAENLLTRGVDVGNLPKGTRVRVGDAVVLEVTQIGKKCHQDCEIFRQVGSCIMPKKGIFTRVLTGGVIRPGDSIVVAAEQK